MFGTIFGFGGRLGRLHYLLLSIVLGLQLAGLTIGIVSRLAPRLAAADSHLPDAPPAGMLLIVGIVVLPLSAWFTLALQAKRFRDMGWRPLHTLLGWFAISVVDAALAASVPSMAMAGHGGTIVGSIVDLGMIGCLMFWPSAPLHHAAPPAAPLRRDARVPAAMSAPVPPASGFGRRRSF